MARRRRVIGAIVGGSTVALFVLLWALGFITNVANAERAFQVPPAKLREAVVRAAATMPRWTLVGEEPNVLRYEARTKTMSFVDDVLIQIVPEGETSKLR